MRFTLKTMMLWVGVAAGLLAVYVQFLAAYVPLWSLAIPCAILVAGACLSAWRFRRLAAVGFVGIAILSNTLYALASLYPDYMLTPALRIAWFMAFLPAIGALGTAWAKLATQVDATPRRSPWVSWASVLVLAMMPGITLATVWPLHLAFLVYRSSLESLADRVENRAQHKRASLGWPIPAGRIGVRPQFEDSRPLYRSQSGWTNRLCPVSLRSPRDGPLFLTTRYRHKRGTGHEMVVSPG